MFKEHNFIIWGDYCKCGIECSILQNQQHPWDNTDLIVKLKCNVCGDEVVINKEKAERFYNNKIYSFFKDVQGNIIDLGCGGGFLSRYLLNNDNINKIVGLDIDSESISELQDIILNPRFKFINTDICNLQEIFTKDSMDYLVSRDVFMFVEDTDKYFDDVTSIVTKGIKQMGWYIEDNKRIKNKLLPEQILEEYTKRGWKAELEHLDWYKSGYFVNAYKGI